MATKKPIDMEIRILTHGQDYIWCKMNSDIQRYDKDGCPIFHAMFTDITEIKSAQKDADIQREKLLKILKNVPAPVFCASYENPFELTAVSTEFAESLGVSREEITNKLSGDLTKFIVEEDIDRVRKELENMDEDKPMQVKYSLKISGAEPFEICDRRKVVTLENGEKYVVGVVEKP